MIISASRRTDIPALYSSWLCNRLADGFVFVRNPMNIHMVSKISLMPSVVDCIVFWTKNAIPMKEKLTQLADYDYYFQYTITNLPKVFEPNIPDVDQNLEMFRFLSKNIGTNRVIWRYDPIIFTDEIDVNWHVKNFQKLCQSLQGLSKKCVLSFIDFYKNAQVNLKQYNYKEIHNYQMLDIAQRLKSIADNYGFCLESCAEKVDLESVGIKHGKCIDDKLIEEIIQSNITIEKDKTQREECGCVASIDIGSYNSCTNGCIYCYANSNKISAHNNNLLHDPYSPLLFGKLSEKDKIYERQCISCKVLQKALF